MPALLATSGSEAISYLRNTPSVLTALHDNIDTIRSVLEKTEGITVLGHRASPIIHLSPEQFTVPHGYSSRHQPRGRRTSVEFIDIG